MKRRKIVSFFCILTGILLIGAAFALYEYNEYESSHSEKEKNIVLLQLQEKIVMDTPEPALDPVFPVLQETPKELKKVNVDGYDYIGYLSFPALEEEFPVMAEWDEKRLKIAPCRYFGSLYTKDLVISGHNYRHGFGKIKRLQEEDLVIFTDADGVEHYYLVAAIETIEPTAISDMIESPWDLSLYTCTYDGRQRYTVRCKQVFMEQSEAGYRK